MLIGIAGPAGAGKTTAANILAWGSNLRFTGFADPLRYEVCQLFGLSLGDLEKRKDETQTLRARPSDIAERLLGHVDDIEPRATRVYAARSGDADCGVQEAVRELLGCSAAELAADTLITARLSPRQALRTIGDFGRGIDPYLYLHAAGQTLALSGEAGAVMHDVRLEIEAQWIRERGGWMLHIQRQGVSYSGAHVTERGPRYAAGDMIVVNPGHIPGFRAELIHALSAMTSTQAAAGAASHV